MTHAEEKAAAVIVEELLRDVARPTHVPPYATQARFIARALSAAGLLSDDAERFRNALVEIDVYLANDPNVWRLNSVAKAGDVLCDVLGAETIQQINASVEANLCASCAAVSSRGHSPQPKSTDEGGQR